MLHVITQRSEIASQDTRDGVNGWLLDISLRHPTFLRRLCK